MAIPAYTFSEEFMGVVNRLEEYFDSKLLNCKLSDTNKSVAIDVPGFFASKYMLALRDRYVKEGWRSVTEDMEREGHWLRFQLP
jgi:hypothetical protein